MSLIRYDGTRVITYDDVEREFLGRTVFLDCRAFPKGDRGYLIASVEAVREQVCFLDKIKMEEYGGRGLIITGDPEEGMMMLGVYDD